MAKNESNKRATLVLKDVYANRQIYYIAIAVADDLHGNERVDAAFVREFHVQLIQNLCEHFGIICHDNVNMDRFQVFRVIFLVDCPVLYRDIV